jgi:hypothetical protein
LERVEAVMSEILSDGGGSGCCSSTRLPRSYLASALANLLG